MTRIKGDIVQEVMTKIIIDRNPARNLVESILKIIKETLATGEDVLISGFGEFRVRQALLHESKFEKFSPFLNLIYALTETGIPRFVILLSIATPILASVF